MIHTFKNWFWDYYSLIQIKGLLLIKYFKTPFLKCIAHYFLLLPLYKISLQLNRRPAFTMNCKYNNTLKFQNWFTLLLTKKLAKKNMKKKRRQEIMRNLTVINSKLIYKWATHKSAKFNKTGNLILNLLRILIKSLFKRAAYKTISIITLKQNALKVKIGKLRELHITSIINYFSKSLLSKSPMILWTLLITYILLMFHLLKIINKAMSIIITINTSLI